MGIVDEDISRVRAATDIVALIGEYVQLRQVGQRWRGLCPFHTEKTGSFYVNAVDGLYHCFGCQASGDAITFIREQEHLGFAEAVERLAGKVGISLNYDKPGESKNRAERKRLADVLAAAEDWYHQRLLSAPDAAPARKYLRDRGFDGDEVREWKVGWAPDDWDQLATALRLSIKDLKATGLGFENRRRRAQDHFRGRILFPIHDSDGTPVGFGGRILPGLEGSKYVNTPQTPMYDKSRVLFALDRAKVGIVAADEVVVCEGYTDVTGVLPRRDPPGRRHVRHCPDRRARAAAPPLRPSHRARLRRRHRRPGRRRPLLPVGVEVRPRRRGCGDARRRRSCATSRCARRTRSSLRSARPAPSSSSAWTASSRAPTWTPPSTAPVPPRRRWG